MFGREGLLEGFEVRKSGWHTDRAGDCGGTDVRGGPPMIENCLAKVWKYANGVYDGIKCGKNGGENSPLDFWGGKLTKRCAVHCT